MTMVGGFDVHRQQITFDYVDDDGLVHWGQIRPATRQTLRCWLAEHCPNGDGEFALEGCTGWRYVGEELAAAGVGVHLGDPAEIAALRGPKKRAKTDRADAKLLARCCWRVGSRSRGSRPHTCWRFAAWAGCTAP
jgi:transposase